MCLESAFPEVQPDFICACDKCEPLSQVGRKEPVYLKGNFCPSKGQVLSLFFRDPRRKLLLRLEAQQGRREEQTHEKNRHTAFRRGSLESGATIQAAPFM